MSIRPRDSGARHEPPRRAPLARLRHVPELLVLVLALALLGFVGNVSAQTPTVTVQFKEASYEVNEGDTLTVTVEVSGTVPSGGFTVYAMDTAIGATGMGVDYVSGPFELAFTAGDHDPTATFPLVTIEDSESDDAEDFAIVLSDYGLPNGVGLGTRFTTEVTINKAADADACAPNLPSDAGYCLRGHGLAGRPQQCCWDQTVQPCAGNVWHRHRRSPNASRPSPRDRRLAR